MSETTATIIDQFRMGSAPNYIAQGDEERTFVAAFRSRIPLSIKGPTGCGKTRFIEFMAHRLEVPLLTVSCHEDLTAADLVGRFLFRDQETTWQDGPLTLAVRYGGICYLDEIVEARKDTTVIIHSLTDDRRMLFLDKIGEVVPAHERFMMVLSYNPGYQSVMKDLKESTKQRFASLMFDYPDESTETEIIASESGLSHEVSERIAAMGARIRSLKGHGLEEGVSTRLLVYMGRLMNQGLSAVEAAECAISRSLVDEPAIIESIHHVVELYFGEIGDGADGGGDVERDGRGSSARG